MNNAFQMLCLAKLILPSYLSCSKFWFFLPADYTAFAFLATILRNEIEIALAGGTTGRKCAYLLILHVLNVIECLSIILIKMNFE